HEAFGIHLITYARFAPALFTVAALCLLYGFVYRLDGDRDSALVAAVMAGMGANVYFAHGTAAGIVRGPGLALAFATLFSALSVLRRQGRGNTVPILTGVLFGLTALTHLSYAVFTGLGLLLLFAFASDLPSLRVALRRCALIAGSAALLVSPWLILVISRYGWSPFTAAGGTHGTFDFWLQSGGDPIRFTRLFGSWVLNLGSDWSPTSLAGLGLFGLGYSLWKGKWFLPAWLLATGAVLGEVSRYGEILGSTLAATALVSIVPLRAHNAAHGEKTHSLRRALLYILIVGTVVYQGGRTISRHRPSLTDPLREAAAWLRNESQPDAPFLLVPNQHSPTEWLPYLARRDLAISHWGAEWTGDYNEQLRLQSELAVCSRRQSFACLEELSARLENPPSCLVISKQLPGLIEQFVVHNEWNQYFENQDYVVMGLEEQCAQRRSAWDGNQRVGEVMSLAAVSAVSTGTRPDLRSAAP
ncbi:MAG: hypothetical protein R3191_01625, partial [Anaerolineales bacterium]|nr:hypothetical protein [Anaerolineales bacterium]